MSDTRHVDASLELLLDTICNTFGGILFISMLVIVMTDFDGRRAAMVPPSDAAQKRLKGLTDEMEATGDELATLRKSLETQSAIEKGVAPDRIRELAQKVAELNQRVTKDTKARNDALAETGAAQQEINKAAKELKKLDGALAAAQSALAAAQKRLKDEQALRSRTARLPRQQKTQKAPIVFFLRGGRLVQLTRRQRDGSLDLETSDCVVSTANGIITSIEPKPGVGLPIDARGDMNGQIESRLSPFDNGRHFVKIFVWPDSFEEFIILREILVRLQFEYGLLRLATVDESVPVGRGTGGGDETTG